jgi:biopolymer transport protein TolR
MSFGRLEKRASPAPMSEINMTPLIDVMLVLLVIFILTAPLMASHLQLELPRAKASAPAAATGKPLQLALDSQGQLFWEGQALSASALPGQLANWAQAQADRSQAQVLLRADQKVPYGQVAQLIAQIQAAGLNRIGFVTDSSPPKTDEPQSR